jgi:hypothetical protein
MKSIIIFPLLAFLLLGCNKDQQLVNDLDGTWQVQSITAIDETNKALPSEGYISFEKCKDQQEEGKCDGAFQFGNEAEVSFRYSAFVTGDDKTINILPDEQEAPYTLKHGWQILKKEKNKLEIEGPLFIYKETANPENKGEVRVRISLEK